MVQVTTMRINDWKARAKALKREVYALCLCSRHPKTPLYAKLFALLIVSYALSPIDLIPDFIPVLGYIDDLVLIPFGVALLIRMMPKDVLEECRQKARLPPANKPKRWTGAVMVVCMWALAIYVTFRIVARIIQN
jgi:uncharacterized membrane protein YkvA (DUF1232 family)